MAPVLDMLNHDEDPNTQRKQVQEEGGREVVHVVALRGVKKGEEIRHTYQWRVIHRNDMALLIYGFINPTEPPLLAAIDLPSYSAENPYMPTDEDDSEYAHSGRLFDRQELARLTHIWSALPTTEAADVALMRSGNVTDWREHMLLEFRIKRKQALRNTIHQLWNTIHELR